jgi:tetratricopeptide (TPR) repeat protein
MRRPTYPLLLALAAPAVILAPLAMAAEPKKAAEKSEKYDPDNVTGISQYVETLTKGTEKFLAKDVTAAIDTYKKAIQLSPRNPLGHYLLAEAYLSSGNLTEADAAINAAYEADQKNVTVRGHVLFLRADIFERQKKWEQAKGAWQAYTEHAAQHADAGVFPQTAAERLKAIQRVMDLEKAYVAVRERIAAEKSDAGKPAAPPPPAKK